MSPNDNFPPPLDESDDDVVFLEERSLLWDGWLGVRKTH